MVLNFLTQQKTVCVIDLENGNYPIKLGGDDVLIELNQFIGDHYSSSSIFILCDSNTVEHCLSKLDWLDLENIKNAEVLEIEPGEASKSIEVYYQSVESLLDLGANRKSVLINLGGGVVSDLGGFIASTFKRGIDFINVPTSLLAMVDAGIGGKTGINAGGAKNQIGTFSEPAAIFISDVFLETLPKKEINSGLGEMVKHLLISDKHALSKLDELTENVKIEDIANSISVKLNFVKRDFKESGSRKALNYGHTFGHAIESFLLNKGISITHGESVLIGILIENQLSVQLGNMSELEKSSIENWMHTKFDLKSFFKQIETEEIISLLQFDKKNKDHSVSFSLVGPIGKCSIDVYPDKSNIESSLSIFCN